MSSQGTPLGDTSTGDEGTRENDNALHIFFVSSYSEKKSFDRCQLSPEKMIFKSIFKSFKLKQKVYDLQKNSNINENRNRIQYNRNPNRARQNYAEAVRNNMPQRRSVQNQFAGRSWQNSRNIICRNCNFSGHYSSACRQPKRCYTCSSLNHISADSVRKSK